VAASSIISDTRTAICSILCCGFRVDVREEATTAPLGTGGCFTCGPLIEED